MSGSRNIIFKHPVHQSTTRIDSINPLKPELNSICYLLALLGAHHFLHVSRIRVKLLYDLSRCARPAAAHLLKSCVRIPPGHGYLSVVSVVCCQIEVSATS